MATWHELIESMKRSGKADPLYVKQVPLSIVKRDLVSVKRDLTDALYVKQVPLSSVKRGLVSVKRHRIECQNRPN